MSVGAGPMGAGAGGPPPGPPPTPPQAGPPPVPAPPPAAPPPPPAGLGAASPLSFLLSDLSLDLTPGWQMLDVAARSIKTALRTPDLAKLPNVTAAVKALHEDLTTMISSYAKGGTQTAPVGPSTAPSEESAMQGKADAGAAMSTDADTLPAPE